MVRYKPCLYFEKSKPCLYFGTEGVPGIVYSIFGLRVPDDGSVTFYRDIKLKLGFGVVHCCYYDKIYLHLIDMGGLGL